MIGEIISHYKILEKLGEGGMGAVYKAEDTRLKRTVALKFLPRHLSSSQDDKVRFIREAQSASSLNHPNISHIYEIDEAGGETFIAMEFIEGESLRTRIDAGPMAVADAVRFAMQIAEGLRAAHNRGIVHRDIKPDNILTASDGVVKIADFGLSLTTGEPKPEEPEHIAGTIAYMSPEQIRGDRIDQSTDIWSLGIVLYEMLTGQLPFKGEYGVAMMYSIGNQHHPPMSGVRKDVPGRLEKLIDRCLEKSPAARFRNVDELLIELQRVRSELPDRTAGETSFAKAVAVLPFADISPDMDNKYFSDGLTEEIIASLSKLRNLKVISRTSVMRYERADKSLKQIAAELGAQYILEGSVRKHGTDLRIITELIDAEQDATLWSEKYRGKLEQVFEIQEEVATKIVDALRVQLSPDEKRGLKKRFTENTEAYQLYLKGRFFWNKRNYEGLTTSIKYFEEALKLDEGYALAWAGLADAHNLNSESGRFSRKDSYQKAKAAVNKALAIDGQLAEAHASLAILKMLDDWNWPAAEKEFRLAISLDPNYATAHHWFAEWLSMMGRHEEAFREISLAAELDPVSAAIVKDKGMVLYYARRYDEAMEQGRKTLELDPSFGTAHRLLSLGYLAKGMIPQALEENRVWGELIENKAETGVGHSYILAAAGNRAEALSILATIDAGERQGGNLFRGIALVHAALGDNDAAFRWLEKAYEDRAESLCMLRVDPKIDPLRGDPRLGVLMKKVGLTP